MIEVIADGGEGLLLIWNISEQAAGVGRFNAGSGAEAMGYGALV